MQFQVISYTLPAKFFSRPTVDNDGRGLVEEDQTFVIVNWNGFEQDDDTEDEQRAH